MGPDLRFLDFRETAPQAAKRDMYLDADGKPVAGASLVGHLAAGVPGTVAGLWEVHHKYGRLTWGKVLQPAIRLARDGFVPETQLVERVAESLPDYAGKTNFDRYFGAIAQSPSASKSKFRQPELARTLERIAKNGPSGFYAGRTADLIVAEMGRGSGIITSADLAAYRPLWREPLITRWRDYTLVTAPPPELRRHRTRSVVAHERRARQCFCRSTA